MTAATQRALSAATALDADTLRGMHLVRYHGSALDLSELDPAHERSLATISRREWVSVHGSRACPRCLAETDGVWQLPWKLSLTAVCVTHGNVLIDSCPECAAPLRRGTRGGPPILSRTHPPAPTACDGRRHTCGADLAAAQALAAPGRLIEVQRRLHHAAQGQRPRLGGQPLPPAEYFSCIRALAAAVRFAAEPNLLPPETPRAITDAFSVYVNLDRGRGGGNAGYRTRPSTATATAAVLAALDDVILADTTLEFEEALEPLAVALEQARERSGHNPLRGLTLPAALTPQRPQFTGRVAGAAPKSADRVAAPVWIPQVVAEVDYQRVATYLPGTYDLTGRRFTALAVVRVAGAHSWAEAAAWTRWPTGVGCHTAGVVTQRISKVDDFWNAVSVITDQLADRGLDLAQRRARLCGLTIIDPSLLSEARGDGSPWTMSRRRCAAAWTWATYTSGDWRVSPAMTDPAWTATTSSRREVYRRFTSRLTDRLGGALCDYAQTRMEEPQ